MISNQTIINCLEEAKTIANMDLLLADNSGIVIASTSDFDIRTKDITDFIISDADTQDISGNLFIKIENEDGLSYALIIKGKVDKNSFFQNLLLDNLLLVDIYNKAQKLHIEPSVPRCVFVIELSAIKDPAAYEMVRELYNTHNGDYVTTVDEDHIIVIKTLQPDESYEDMDDNAKMLVDMFNSEAMTNVRVSYGTIVNDIKGVSKSYKEANMALDVGKIFYADKTVIAYSTLGIGRLIYQLPINLCEMFIDEVFGGELSEEIDEEILNTIDKFLENSLNVSETSRQLYIHRNTLVYRIEKLEKATGMDVRNFDDALSFKIAMMVRGYINYIKEQNR